ncbi:hypothetical protein PTKU15_08200 [Paraburkholderia terrae]|nr:hypothetical protein PTKU15_08200 [Paraburkholderia terrae]
MASRLGDDVGIVTSIALAERPMMHQFLPDAHARFARIRRVPRAYHLRKVTPSSIVPYIVMLPDPADDEPEPPCAHALQRTTAMTTANRIFITALFR